MRSTQFKDITAEELSATWAHADATPRVDAPRMQKRAQHDKQLTQINHAKRYRAERKAKLQAQAQAA